MGTFELGCDQINEEVAAKAKAAGGCSGCGDVVDRRKIKQECIICAKVYDQCRQQHCLTPNILGPARAHRTTVIGGVTIHEGEIIVPPSDAAAVTIDHLRLSKIIIVEKEPNTFKPGFWDIDLKYVFVYSLIFRDARGEKICCIRANSIFNNKVTLFGSIGTDLVIGTDLLRNQNETLDADPLVYVEGKAIALDADLRYCGCCPQDCCCGQNGNAGSQQLQGHGEAGFGAVEVDVTIGLFTIIKLFRIVSLTVESRGFCNAPVCEEVCPVNPCDFFDRLEFPMNIFAPPQKEDFCVGDVISTSDRGKEECGCK